MSAIRPALLIIDMQNDFVRPGAPLRVAGAEAAIPAMQQVLGVFRSLSLPVIHIVRVHRPDGTDVEIIRKEIFRENPFAVDGTPGAAIVSDLAPLPGETILKKVRMSAFIGTELDLILDSRDVNTVVVTGIQTPNCIRATVYDAIAYNYRVILVRDAVAAQSDEIHAANLRDMQNIGTRLIHSSELEPVLADGP